MVRRKKKDLIVVGDHGDPRGMPALAEKYLEWIAVRKYSEQTVRNRRLYLGYFFSWCEERSLTRPGEITKPILERYQRHLYFYRKKENNGTDI